MVSRDSVTIPPGCMAGNGDMRIGHGEEDGNPLQQATGRAWA